MPIRYPCPAAEAGEQCDNRLCLHAVERADDGSVVESHYLWGTILARLWFDRLPEAFQQMLFQLLDMEYIEDRFLDDE
jgi:hypothetical protein